MKIYTIQRRDTGQHILPCGRWSTRDGARIFPRLSAISFHLKWQPLDTYCEVPVEKIDIVEYNLDTMTRQHIPLKNYLEEKQHA